SSRTDETNTRFGDLKNVRLIDLTTRQSYAACPGRSWAVRPMIAGPLVPNAPGCPSGQLGHSIRLDDWPASFLSEEHPPAGLPASVLHVHVLAHRVDVAPATLERRRLEDGRGTSLP